MNILFSLYIIGLLFILHRNKDDLCFSTIILALFYPIIYLIVFLIYLLDKEKFIKIISEALKNK